MNYFFYLVLYKLFSFIKRLIMLPSTVFNIYTFFQLNGALRFCYLILNFGFNLLIIFILMPNVHPT